MELSINDTLNNGAWAAMFLTEMLAVSRILSYNNTKLNSRYLGSLQRQAEREFPNDFDPLT